MTKAAHTDSSARKFINPEALLLSQEILDLVFVDDLLFEGIGTGLRAAYSADYLCPVLRLSGLLKVFYLCVFGCCFCHDPDYLVTPRAGAG
jgi:hypothetical protein